MGAYMTKCRIGGREVDLDIEKRVRGSMSRHAPVNQWADSKHPQGRSESEPVVAPSPLYLLLGQLPSGKNAIGITRTGHHYAKPRFREWREDAMVQLKALGRLTRSPIDYPVHFKAWYWAGDRITRDVSGLQDALFHLLEYSKILKNDGLIRDVTWRYQGLNRKNPKVEFLLSPME